MAPEEPILGAALIARFMATVAGLARFRRHGDTARAGQRPARPRGARAGQAAAPHTPPLPPHHTLPLLTSPHLHPPQIVALLKRRQTPPQLASTRRSGPERAHRGRRRWPDPDGARRAQPGQARSSLTCHRTAGCAVRPPNSRTRQEEPHVDRHRPALLRPLPRPGRALELRLRGPPLRRLLVPRLALRRRGDAARRGRRARPRGLGGRRVHLDRRPGRHAGERPRPGVLRRRAASPHHVPLDRRPSGRGRPGGGGRRAHDPGRDAPDHRRRSLRGASDGRLRRGRRAAAADELRPPRVRLRLAGGAAGRRERGRLGRRVDIDLLLMPEVTAPSA